MTQPLRIEAIIDPRERTALVAAAQQLSECLGQAAGAEWPVQLLLRSPGQALSTDVPAVVVASLLPEVARLDERIEITQTRWRILLKTLTADAAAVSILNVFRYVAPSGAAGQPSAILERIRRLDLMAVQLSSAPGVGLIDIDRTLAHVGAGPAHTDYQLGGRVAAEIVGHQIVWHLLSCGLDATIPTELQERAKAVHGDLSDIDAFVKRRTARPLVRSSDG